MNTIKSFVDFIEKKYKIDFCHTINMGITEAMELVEINRGKGENSSYYSIENAGLVVSEFDADIDWGIIEKKETDLPTGLAIDFVKLFANLDYYILPMSPYDIEMTNAIQKGFIPEGIVYEMKQHGNKVDGEYIYKLVNYKGSITILYSKNPEAEYLLKIIDSYEE